MMRARLIPICRARVLAGSGSLFATMEMKIRLSIPNTISMAAKDTKAAQASGEVKSSIIGNSPACMNKGRLTRCGDKDHANQ